MNDYSTCVEEISDGLKVSVKVQPRASKNEIGNIREGALQIKLTAPPVDGSANKLLIQTLSKKLKLAKSCIEILSGEKSRHKRIFIQGITMPDFQKALN